MDGARAKPTQAQPRKIHMRCQFAMPARNTAAVYDYAVLSLHASVFRLFWIATRPPPNGYVIINAIYVMKETDKAFREDVTAPSPSHSAQRTLSGTRLQCYMLCL